MAPPPTLALTFLAPAAGIIAAAITVPLLLLLYFLRLRRRPVRISSTLLWEQAVQDLQVNAPFRMIRFSWLLVLQLLALLCLILAVARPAIDLPSFGSDRVILLIDRSASMRATDADGGGTRLEEAKERAAELVDRLGGGETRIMVVEFASTARAVLNFSRDRGAVRNAIDAIEQTDQPDDLAGALRVVEAFALGGEDGEESPPRVPWLLRDGCPRRRHPSRAWRRTCRSGGS
ncbi:MAG: VWA domain-containing protein, partial [Planctomycetota bacterium]